MAKKKSETVAKTAAPTNLFAAAAKKAAATPKKEKGTIITLPKELDAEGKLVGESKILNESVTAAIEAKAEEKTAATKGALAKTKLKNFAQSEVVKLYAKYEVPPATPVSVVNHMGESVTYVMADKSQQNPISEEQVALFEELLGEDGAAKVVHKKQTFFFDTATMEQQAANDKEHTVFEIVCELINKIMANETRLSQDQKNSLIKSVVKTYLEPNTLGRIAALCGSDAAKIAQFYDAAGTACVRSIQV
jgi:hypothetical protein